MNNNVKNVLIFAMGLGIGVFTGVFLTREKYKAEFEEYAEEEIEDVTEYYRNKIKAMKEATKDNENSVDDTNEIKNDKPKQTPKEKLLEKANKIEYNKITSNYREETEEDLEQDEKNRQESEDEEMERISAKANRKEFPAPYIISFEDFDGTEIHYDKLNIYYYEGDDTLADVDESIIDNRRQLVGDEFYDNFDKHNTCYVRNEGMSTDYEIIRNQGYYQEIVLGEDVKNINGYK